ncbi:MAG: aldo/keto reductase [Candidatus Limnocylindrales bacterium]
MSARQEPMGVTSFEPTERVPLGRTDVQVPQLGIGTNPLGGLHAEIPHAVARSTVETAWRTGVRYYDVAPVYGYGYSERIVGEVLRQRPRDEYLLTTKVGRLLLAEGPADHEDTMVLWEGTQLYKGTDPVKPYFDFSYDGVMRSLEASRERMGIERFDALHIHDPDWFPDEALDGAYRALAELKAAGEIGAIGVGVNQWQILVDYARRADFDAFLLAGRYTLLDQSALPELLPLCQEKGISIIAGGVYNSGILSHPDPGTITGVSSGAEAIETWKDNVTFNYVPAEKDIIERAAALKVVCDRHGVPLMAAAIQFPMHHPAVATVLTGPRSPEHVVVNNEMLRFPIPDGLWVELKAEGLLPSDAPTPG